jgi:Acetyltransferase (GNAT) family.
MTHGDQFGELEVTVRATLRACRKEDLPALEWMGLYSRHREIIHNTFEAQERGEALMLLAVAAGFPIAQIWIDFGQDERPPKARLWAVRTFFPLQRAGIGRRIMVAAERILAGRRIARAELEVEAGDREILPFYRKLGWQIIRHPRERGGSRERFLLAKAIAAA